MSSSSYTSSSSEYADVGYRIPVPALIAHGFMISFTVGVFLPNGAMIIQVVPWTNKVTRLYAPIQALTLAIILSGIGVGIYLSVTTTKISYYHPIIGFIYVGRLLLFQPLVGLYSHLHFQGTGAKTAWGSGSQEFSCLELQFGVNVAYSVVAGVILSAYLVVLIVGTTRQEALAKTSRKPQYL
ncbi:unnamed protein product [Penicillium manginii]